MNPILIYLVFNNVTKKAYLGQTKFSHEKRWLQHQSEARNGSPSLLHRAIRKYGASAFEVLPVVMLSTRELANRVEKFGILSVKKHAVGCYNLALGGQRTSEFSTEARDRISKSLQGRKRTPEHIARLSAAHRNPNAPDERIAALYAEGKSMREVSIQLGTTPSTIRKRLDALGVAIRGVGVYSARQIHTPERREQLRKNKLLWWSSPRGLQVKEERHCQRIKSV